MSSKSIKIVCISDTHGRTDEKDFPEIPDGDILLHAGDISQQGTVVSRFSKRKFSKLSRFSKLFQGDQFFME